MSQAQGKANQGEEVKIDASQQNKSSPSSPLKGEAGPNYEAFVKNLPFSASQEAIGKFFEQCGTVERVNVLRQPGTGRSKGVAFVRFSNDGALQKALGLSGQNFEDRPITIEKTVPKEQRPAGNDRRRDDRQNERDPNSTSVFVGNLNYSTTEETLRQLFSDCGSIKEIRVATDPSGRSRGFAHVDFEEPESVEKAVQKSGEEIEDRNIRVDYSNKRGEGGNRGGFRGGFNRGGSRGGFSSRGGSRGGPRGGYRGGQDGERGRGGFRGSRRGN